MKEGRKCRLFPLGGHIEVSAQDSVFNFGNNMQKRPSMCNELILTF